MKANVLPAPALPKSLPTPREGARPTLLAPRSQLAAQPVGPPSTGPKATSSSTPITPPTSTPTTPATHRPAEQFVTKACGVLKVFNAARGFGFISPVRPAPGCSALPPSLPEDQGLWFFDGHALPESAPLGSDLVFEVWEKSGGKPQATAVTLATPDALAAAAAGADAADEDKSKPKPKPPMPSRSSSLKTAPLPFSTLMDGHRPAICLTRVPVECTEQTLKELHRLLGLDPNSITGAKFLPNAQPIQHGPVALCAAPTTGAVVLRYSSTSAAEDAILKLRGHVVRTPSGAEKVLGARFGTAPPEGRRDFVGNDSVLCVHPLPVTFSATDMREKFEKYGGVVEAEVQMRVYDKVLSRSSKGLKMELRNLGLPAWHCGMVRFEATSQAERALGAEDGTKVPELNCDLIVECGSQREPMGWCQGVIMRCVPLANANRHVGLIRSAQVDGNIHFMATPDMEAMCEAGMDMQGVRVDVFVEFGCDGQPQAKNILVKSEVKAEAKKAAESAAKAAAGDKPAASTSGRDEDSSSGPLGQEQEAKRRRF